MWETTYKYIGDEWEAEFKESINNTEWLSLEYKEEGWEQKWHMELPKRVIIELAEKLKKEN